MQDQEPTEPRQGIHVVEKHGTKALLLGLVLLVLGAPVVWKHQHQGAPQARPVASVATSPGVQHAPVGLADFGETTPSPDARLVANWALATHDNANHALMIVDKKDARVHVLAPDGRLQGSAPILLGAAPGDDILPGAGEKTPAQLKPEEKTTPAGRFVAEPGVNANKEDVIWVDYGDAISMHRVRTAVAREHRLERLASPGTEDNRISFGCINLPAAFYDTVARPAVATYGAVVYVLPEMKTVQEVFGAYDVTDPAQVAATRHGNLARAGRKAGAA